MSTLAESVKRGPHDRSIPQEVIEQFAVEVGKIEEIATSIAGISTGPRWSEDPEWVAAHLSATYYVGQTSYRVRIIFNLQGKVVSRKMGL